MRVILPPPRRASVLSWIAARAGRQVSGRCSLFAVLRHGSGSKPTPWANNLLEAVRKNFDLTAWDTFSKAANRGTAAGGETVSGAAAGSSADQPLHRGVQRRNQSGLNLGQRRGLDLRFYDIAGQKDPTIISMLGWPGPISQYHAANVPTSIGSLR